MGEHETDTEPNAFDVTRRTVIETGTTALVLATLPRSALAADPVDENESPPSVVKVELEINGHPHSLTLDSRTTLLDALREHLALTGSKKDYDHGQCGWPVTFGMPRTVWRVSARTDAAQKCKLNCKPPNGRQRMKILSSCCNEEKWSEREDLNLRPLVSQTSALTGLRHAPMPFP
jgi:hypothetical protein